MKQSNFYLVFFIIAITILSLSCSGYCDDEDLRRDKDTKMAVVKHIDSIDVD